MSPAAARAWLHAPASPVFLARAAVTLAACMLAAGVAFTAPAWARPVLDAFAGWVLAVAAAFVAARAFTAAGDAAAAAEPRAWRAVGRVAFRVARACYAAARAR